MKITRRQLKRIIREAYGSIQLRAPAKGQDIIDYIVSYFKEYGVNYNTEADIYQQLLMHFKTERSFDMPTLISAMHIAEEDDSGPIDTEGKRRIEASIARSVLEQLINDLESQGY